MLKPGQGGETAQAEPKFKRAGFAVSPSLLPAVCVPIAAGIQVKNTLGFFYGFTCPIPLINPSFYFHRGCTRCSFTII